MVDNKVIHVDCFSIRKREPMKEISETEERDLINEIGKLIWDKGYMYSCVFSNYK